MKKILALLLTAVMVLSLAPLALADDVVEIEFQFHKNETDAINGMTAVIDAFNAANPDGVGLDVILPESKQNALEQAFTNEAVKNLSKGIEVKNVKGLANGFRIGPRDGGYQLSFTGDDFTDLIGEYLRPATKKILFGK